VCARTRARVCVKKEKRRKVVRPADYRQASNITFYAIY